MNLNNEGWALEFEDGRVMDGNNAEHIREAARVVSQYCDVLAVRSFPSLTDKQKDEQENVISSFVQHASVPVISLEGSVELTFHRRHHDDVLRTVRRRRALGQPGGAGDVRYRQFGVTTDH